MRRMAVSGGLGRGVETSFISQDVLFKEHVPAQNFLVFLAKTVKILDERLTSKITFNKITRSADLT